MREFKVGDLVTGWGFDGERTVESFDSEGDPIMTEDEYKGCGWGKGSIKHATNTDNEPDPINHPDHYQSESGIECIDAIRAALTPEEFRGYCKGAALKYIWRERKKGGDESLGKGVWYLNEAQK